jgi:hypothetical protein
MNPKLHLDAKQLHYLLVVHDGAPMDGEVHTSTEHFEAHLRGTADGTHSPVASKCAAALTLSPCSLALSDRASSLCCRHRNYIWRLPRLPFPTTEDDEDGEDTPTTFHLLCDSHTAARAGVKALLFPNETTWDGLQRLREWSEPDALYIALTRVS